MLHQVSDFAYVSMSELLSIMMKSSVLIVFSIFRLFLFQPLVSCQPVEAICPRDKAKLPGRQNREEPSQSLSEAARGYQKGHCPSERKIQRIHKTDTRKGPPNPTAEKYAKPF